MRQRWATFVSTCVALGLAAGAAGCGLTSNKVVPLAGEDPKALAVAGDRAAWLERTGATRALEDLRRALRAGDDGVALGLLGPKTRMAAKEKARDARIDAEALLGAAQAQALGAEAAATLALLRTEGPATIREAVPYDPTRREVTVRIKVGDRDEASVPAVYTEGGWRIELVRTNEAPPATAGKVDTGS